MAKLYFKDNDENCYGLDHFIDFMRENNLQELQLFEAKRETGTGYFFCKEFGEIGDVSEGSCGKQCGKYTPNNGKNGRCKHYGYTYEQTKIELILKLR